MKNGVEQHSKGGLKLLCGHSVFLDLRGYRDVKKFEENLKLLGATIETSFSKEVNLVVSNRKGGRTQRPGNEESPLNPSPFTGSVQGADSPGESPSYLTDQKPLTRGQAIAKKANLTKHYGTTDILNLAKQWKIKVIWLDDALKLIKKELDKLQTSGQKSGSCRKKKKRNVKPLSGDYVKFESLCKQFRPVQQAFQAFPDVAVNTPSSCCPFDKAKGHGRHNPLAVIERAEREHVRDEKEEERESLKQLEMQDGAAKRKPSKAKTQSKNKGEGSSTDPYCMRGMATAGDIRRKQQEKMKAEQKRGYCELCEVKYEDLNEHTRSDQHRDFVRNDHNYQSLDNMIHVGSTMDKFLNDVIKYGCHHYPAEADGSEDDCDGVNLLSPFTSPRVKPRVDTQTETGHAGTSKKLGSKKEAAKPVDQFSKQSTPIRKRQSPKTPTSKCVSPPDRKGACPDIMSPKSNGLGDSDSVRLTRSQLKKREQLAFNDSVRKKANYTSKRKLSLPDSPKAKATLPPNVVTKEDLVGPLQSLEQSLKWTSVKEKWRDNDMDSIEGVTKAASDTCVVVLSKLTSPFIRASIKGILQNTPKSENKKTGDFPKSENTPSRSLRSRSAKAATPVDMDKTRKFCAILESETSPSGPVGLKKCSSLPGESTITIKDFIESQNQAAKTNVSPNSCGARNPLVKSLQACVHLTAAEERKPHSLRQAVNSPNKVEAVNSPTKEEAVNSPNKVEAVNSPNKAEAVNPPTKGEAVNSPNKGEAVNSPNKAEAVNPPTKEEAVNSPNMAEKLAGSVSSPKHASHVHVPIDKNTTRTEFLSHGQGPGCKENDQAPAEKRQTLKCVASPSKRNQAQNTKATMTGSNSVTPSSKPRKKVALRENWSILSEESVKTLFQPDSDDEEFEGFGPSNENVKRKYSFVEISEVELSDNSEREWIIGYSSELDKKKSPSKSPKKQSLSEIVSPVKIPRLDMLDSRTSTHRDPSSEWDNTMDTFIDETYQRAFGLTPTAVQQPKPQLIFTPFKSNNSKPNAQEESGVVGNYLNSLFGKDDTEKLWNSPQKNTKSPDHTTLRRSPRKLAQIKNPDPGQLWETPTGSKTQHLKSMPVNTSKRDNKQVPLGKDEPLVPNHVTPSFGPLCIRKPSKRSPKQAQLHQIGNVNAASIDKKSVSCKNNTITKVVRHSPCRGWLTSPRKRTSIQSPLASTPAEHSATVSVSTQRSSKSDEKQCTPVSTGHNKEKSGSASHNNMLPEPTVASSKLSSRKTLFHVTPTQTKEMTNMAWLGSEKHSLPRKLLKNSASAKAKYSLDDYTGDLPKGRHGLKSQTDYKKLVSKTQNVYKPKAVFGKSVEWPYAPPKSKADWSSSASKNVKSTSPSMAEGQRRSPRKMTMKSSDICQPSMKCSKLLEANNKVRSPGRRKDAKRKSENQSVDNSPKTSEFTFCEDRDYVGTGSYRSQSHASKRQKNSGSMSLDKSKTEPSGYASECGTSNTYLRKTSEVVKREKHRSSKEASKSNNSCSEKNKTINKNSPEQQFEGRRTRSKLRR